MDNLELVLKEDATALEQFRFNAAVDSKNNVFRVSNEVISGLMAMNSSSWRMFEFVAMHLDIYPLELRLNDEFIEAFNQGKKYIPSEYRTVTLTAAEYVKTFKLTDIAGRKQFVRDALSLFNEAVEIFQGNKLRLSRPITDIEFEVERRVKGKGAVVEKLYAGDMLGEKPAATQAARLTIEINENLALAMLFVVKNFTRLDNKIKAHLSPVANKLYTYLKMQVESESRHREQIFVTWDLDTWNRFLHTNHKSITRLAGAFPYDKQLTERTDLTVISGIDKSQKRGRAYTHFYVGVMKTPTHELIEHDVVEVKPTRKRLPPRPKVLKGSDAEGVWARKCIRILDDFEKELKAHKRVLPKADRDRRTKYLKIIGEVRK